MALRTFIFLVVVACFLSVGIAKSNPVASSQVLPTIPIQIINTNAGRVMTAHATQYHDKVYIGGLVYRPSSPGMGAHVHVWGVDQKDHPVFFKTTSVEITGKSFSLHSESFVVSVTPAVFKKAHLIYVTFHSQSDSESTRQQ